MTGLTAADADTFSRCMAVHGVAVFPADTVYGLACEPESKQAVHRLYALKGRAPGKPAAVMFFDRDLAAAALPELGPRIRAALPRLLPGGVTLLLPNPEGRFPLACGEDPGTLGLRVPALADALAPLRAVRWPVLQSSANIAGGPDACRVEDVADEVRDGADLILDAGALPGTSSTVLDLRRYETYHAWEVVRAGAVSADEIGRRLA